MQDEDGWASWGWLGQVAIQVIRAGLVDKVAFEQILKAMRGQSCGHLRIISQTERTAGAKALG